MAHEIKAKQLSQIVSNFNTSFAENNSQNIVPFTTSSILQEYTDNTTTSSNQQCGAANGQEFIPSSMQLSIQPNIPQLTMKSPSKQTTPPDKKTLIKNSNSKFLTPSLLLQPCTVLSNNLNNTTTTTTTTTNTTTDTTTDSMNHSNYSIDNITDDHLNNLLKCQICSKVFKTIAALKSHKITHTSIRPFQCLVCNKKFKSESGVTTHINMLHHMPTKNKDDSVHYKKLKITAEQISAAPVKLNTKINKTNSGTTSASKAPKQTIEPGPCINVMSLQPKKTSRTNSNQSIGAAKNHFSFPNGLPHAIKLVLMSEPAVETEDNSVINNRQPEQEIRDPPQMNLNMRYESLSWPCGLCEEVLSYKQTFLYHMLHQHNSNVLCRHCKKIFQTSDILETHILAVHS